jgi:hypothetical protein
MEVAPGPPKNSNRFPWFYRDICFSKRTSSVVWWSQFLARNPEVPGSIPAQQIFLELGGLERGPLSLMSTSEDLLE